MVPMPEDIEFRVRGDSTDEPIGTPPPSRSRGRWSTALVALVLVGAVAGFVVRGRNASDPPSRPTPSPTASERPPAVWGSAVVATAETSADIDDIAVVGARAVAVANGSLVAVSVDSNERLHVSDGPSAGLPFGDPTESDWTLKSDGRGLWAISTSGRLYRIDPHTLRVPPLIPVPAPFNPNGAAPLDGHLYLATPAGLYDLPPAPARLGPPMSPGAGPVAADPTRSRLLVVQDDGQSIRSYVPQHPSSTITARVRFVARSLAVADGVPWAAGADPGADTRLILARLDPSTLRVVGQITLTPAPIEPMTVVAGESDLWVRSGQDLWCVDPRTGSVAQHWSRLPGRVAAGGGHAFIADENFVGLLRLNGRCVG